MATALLGSVAALVALALPWWSASSGRSATPTANGLFPTLTMSLVVLAVAGVDVAMRMRKNFGAAPHALIAMAIAALTVVGIAFYALDNWGEATRGYGQVAALIGATSVLTTATWSLTSAGPPRPVDPDQVPRTQPVVQRSLQEQSAESLPPRPSTTPPVATPTVAASVPVTPQQSPESPSTSFWFRVEIAEPLFASDGVNAISLLQPGRRYLAVGLAPGWVIAQDGQGGTGYVHLDKIVRDA
jgi:hypothetical protein